MHEPSNTSDFIHQLFLKGNTGHDTGLMIASVLYFTILTGVYLLFYRRKKNGYLAFVKEMLVAPTIAGGILIYFCGYHLAEPESTFISKVFLSVFSTARLFILGNDLIEVHTHVNNAYRLWFSIFSVSAAVISTSIILNLFGKRLINWYRIYFNRSGEICIFFGINKPGISLARDIIRKKRDALIVFIHNPGQDEEDSLPTDLDESGVVTISRDSVSDSFNLQHEELIFRPGEGGNHSAHRHKPEGISLKKIRLLRKIKKHPASFFFLTDNEKQNFHHARLLSEELKACTLSHPVHLHVRTTTWNMDERFHEWSLNNTDSAVFHLHNAPAIAATQLVSDHLPVHWLDGQRHAVKKENATVQRDFTVMILGFGATGKAALLKLFEHGQFVGSQFRAIVADQDMDKEKGRFLNRYPGVAQSLGSNLQFHEYRAGSTGLFDLVRTNADQLDYIIVTLGDDDLSLQTADDLNHLLRKTNNQYQIFVHSGKSIVSSESHPGKDPAIQFFGTTEAVFTQDIIIRGKLEKIAEKIHDAYNHKVPEGKRKSWRELDRFTQLSNISVAEHALTKIALCGLTPEEIKRFDSYADLEKYLRKERIANMGKTEHLRWNAYHFMHGWTTWNLADIPENQSENQDNQKKLHACLVSWEQLAEVSHRFKNEDYYSYDLGCMKDIFDHIIAGFYDEHDLKRS